MTPRRLLKFVVMLASAQYTIACTGEMETNLGPVDPTDTNDGGSQRNTPQDAAIAAKKDGATQIAVDAGDAASSAGASGLPCDVDALLQQSCRSCHGATPIGGAPMALVSYAQLLAPAPTDPSVTVAARSLAMMQAATMPPGGGLAQTDLATFASWVQSGTPMGTCGTDGGTAPDPYNTPVTCTSNKTWTGGNRESPSMHPGSACISCHSSGEGPSFEFAGTLYPSAHEPTDCNGSSAAGASVIITDANGTDHTLTPNSVGNFYLAGTFKKPYSAKLVYQGRTRAMVTKQTDGDCNGCHTESGDNGAPGRIMLP